MKNIFHLLIKGRFNELLFEKTDDTWLQIFRTLFVGALSFLSDAIALFLLEKAGLHYLIAAGFAFLVGLGCNYILSKLFVFAKANVHLSALGEFLGFAVIALIGLAFTEILMYLLTDFAHLHFMFSKAIAAVIVLFWNFGARKMILYKDRSQP